MSSQSLVRLTLESSQYERGLRQAQKQLSDFTRALGVNMKSLSGVALAAGTVTGALKVAKDAFFKNEQQLDEWGRTVEASKSLYSGFLNALNTGDISGYLSNISKITQAARAAYDALDALSTFNAFNQINVEKTRTAMMDAIVDYREGNGSKEAVKAAGEAYKNELKERKKLEKDAYLESIRKIAAERGVEYKDLLDALSGSYGNYQELKKVMPSGSRIVNYGGGMFGAGGSYTETFAQGKREKLGETLRQFNDTELKGLQALGAQAERTAYEMTNIDRQIVRVLGRGNIGAGGGTSGGKNVRNVEGFGVNDFGGLGISLTESMSELRSRMKEYQQMMADATTQTMYEAARKGIEETQRLLDAQPLALRMGISAEDAAKLKEQKDSIIGIVQEGLKNEAKNITPLSNLNEIGDELYKNFTDAASAIGAIGSAMSSIEDPAAKVFGTIAQAIATVALSFAKSLEKTVSPWDWIPAAIAGTATMISTIASIKSATSGNFANGGIVPGNNFSGDMLRTSDYGINSGELILNKAQQNNIASELTKSENNVGGKAEATISAETIKIVLKTGASRRGVSVGEWLEL